MKKTSLLSIGLASLFALAGAAPAQASAYSAAFTYQGHVKVDGEPFTGAGQFKFAIVRQINQATASATVTGGLDLNSTAAPGSGRIDNVAGALIDVRTFNLAIAATSHPGDAAAAFIDNSGIFRKSTGNTYQINVPFFNRAGGTIPTVSKIPHRS